MVWGGWERVSGVGRVGESEWCGEGGGSEWCGEGEGVSGLTEIHTQKHPTH